MGLDPFTKGALGSAGIGALGGALSGSDQVVPESMAHPGVQNILEIDPRRSLDAARRATTGLGEWMQERVGRGVQLPSAYVQQPATFHGEGLPMPIGVTAFDQYNPYFTPSMGPGQGSGGPGAGGPGGPPPGSTTPGGPGGPGGGGPDLFGPRQYGGGGGGGGDEPLPEEPPNWNQFPDDPRTPVIPAPPAEEPEPGPLPPPVQPPGGGGGGDDDGGDDGTRPPEEPTLPPYIWEPGPIDSPPGGCPPGQTMVDGKCTSVDVGVGPPSAMSSMADVDLQQPRGNNNRGSEDLAGMPKLSPRTMAALKILGAKGGGRRGMML